MTCTYFPDLVPRSNATEHVSGYYGTPPRQMEVRRLRNTRLSGTPKRISAPGPTAVPSARTTKWSPTPRSVVHLHANTACRVSPRGCPITFGCSRTTRSVIYCGPEIEGNSYTHATVGVSTRTKRIRGFPLEELCAIRIVPRRKSTLKKLW